MNTLNSNFTELPEEDANDKLIYGGGSGGEFEAR